MLTTMSSQVISYRLSTDEVLALREKALPGESNNQTAQRLMREALGVSTLSTAPSTTSLDDRIESIVGDKLSSFMGNVNDLLSRLQERLQQVESRLEGASIPVETEASPPFVDTVDKSVDKDDKVTDTGVDDVDSAVDKESDRELSQVELAKRLGVHPATLTKNRSKANFTEWVRAKDPEQLAWEYKPSTERYTVLSTDVDRDAGEDNLAGWKARVDAVVGAL